jgi:predicted dithiol-disulfide oxidoreductase (DUF899 family)
MSVVFPGESAQYRIARDRLLEREVELRRQSEAVATARRELPPGGAVPQDYVFQEAGPDGSTADVRLSELFAPGQDSRHNDLIDPLWNFFDFTPEGRGTDWYPELSYPSS